MFVVLALALSGCTLTDPNDPTAPAIAPQPPGQPQSVVPVVPLEPRLASGTRLEAIAWEAPGDVLAFQTFWDTELDLGCDFLETEDGSERCLPNPAYSDLLYLDANCTEPALGMRFAPPRAYEAVLVSADGICGEAHMMAVETGDPIPFGAGTPLYVDFGHGCEARSTYTPDMPDYLNTFEVVPLDTFVRAERYPAIAGDAFASVLVADDGARHVRSPGLSDGTFCWTQPTETGERCLPSTGANRSTREPFADATCSEPVAMMNAPECDHDVAIEWDDSGNFAIRPILGPYEGDLYVLSGANTCGQDNDFQPTRAPVLLGDVVPSTAWPAMARASYGTTELTQAMMTSRDGVPIAPDRSGGTYLESLFVGSTPCILATLDAQTVCIPEPSGRSLFADAACTTPLVGEPGQIAVVWADGLEGLDVGTLPIADAVYTAGAPYAGQVFRQNYDGTCEEYWSTAHEAVPFAPVTLTQASL